VRHRQLIHRAIESLEFRRLLSSSTLTEIPFNGTDGYAPAAAVEDASGDIFGVTSFTENGQNLGNGAVFEIAAGTTKIIDLADFPSTSLQSFNQGESLIIDSAGDLFGTDTGALFEIAKGTHTLKTLVTFANFQTSGNVYAVDSRGDLFGLNQGNVFELPATSSTIDYALFGSSQGLQSLALGPDGNLYGTTSNTLVEDNLTTNTATTLATFNRATTGATPTGLAFDAQGNIWGFCTYGGPNGGSSGDGTVWEYDKSTQTLIEQAAFTSANGYTPIANPVIDGDGTLYGLTTLGGANDDGTLFSIDIGVSDSATPAAIKPDDLGSIIPDFTFNNSNAPTSGSFLVPYNRLLDFNYSPILADPEGSVSGYGALLAATPSPPLITVPTSKLFKSDATQAAADAEQQQNLQNQALAAQAAQASPSSANTKAFDPETPSLAATRSEQIAHIKALLADAGKDITTAKAEITKGIDILDSYNTLGTDITSLDKQLAAATKDATKDKLQKEIDADTTDQDADATEDNDYYTEAGDRLTDISDLLTDAKSDLNDLPKAQASFTGSVVAVPSPLTRGKKATVVVGVTNDGDVTAVGALTIALFVRPLGTTGSADVSLPVDAVNISIAAGATADQSLTFKVPKTLANGHYSLVVEIDPKSLYKESEPAAPIVSTQIFRVN
jgi:uncharacterized repeat protein (TIGR03803 family)